MKLLVGFLLGVFAMASLVVVAVSDEIRRGM